MDGTLEIQVLVSGRSMLLLLVYMFAIEYGRITRAKKMKDRGPHDNHYYYCDKNMCYPCLCHDNSSDCVLYLDRCAVKFWMALSVTVIITVAVSSTV